MRKWFVWIVIGVALCGMIAWRVKTKAASTQAAGSQASGRRGGGPVEVATVVRRPVVQTLEAVGNIKSPSRGLISSKFSGRIEYIEVREGDLVTVGQALVRLDPSEIQAQVLQQQANVAEARSRAAQAKLNQGPTDAGIQGQIEEQRANLTSAEAAYQQVLRNYDALVASAQAEIAAAEGRVRSTQAQVKTAEAEVGRQEANRQNAQARANRLKDLMEKGYVAEQSYEDARTALEVQKGAVAVAQSQLSSARSAVESSTSELKVAQQQRQIVERKAQADIVAAKARITQGQAGVKVADANRAQTPAYQQNLAALESAVRAAVAQLQQAQARLADTVLRSPISGTVTGRFADLGSLASPSQPILEVQALDNMLVTASFPVEQIGKVQVGQPTNVRIDAIPGSRFGGKIANVNFAADPLTRQFSVLVKLPNPSGQIRPGMYATVALEIGRVEDAIVVPREAVKTTKDGSTVVVVGKDKKAVIRAVKLGVMDNSGVQILSGVQPGEQVVVLSYAPIRDGQAIVIADKKAKGTPKP